MNNLKKRIYTSILLLIILYISLINNIILSLFLIFIFYFLLIEFNYIFKKIYNKRKLYHFLVFNLVNIYSIFFLATIFIYLTANIYNNKIIFLFLLSISVATDIGGYVFGKTFKGKKLTKISPNKTYSGLFGSFLLPIIVSSIFFNNLDLNINYLLITVLLSFISQAGDLMISYLKRLAKIKDTGSFLPGHGGILDRIDGILFALPLGLILINF